MDISALLTPASARPATNSQSAGNSKNASTEGDAKPFAQSLQKAIQSAPDNPQQRDAQRGAQIPVALTAQGALSTAELRQVLSARHGVLQEQALAAEPENGEDAAADLAPMAIPLGLAPTAPLQPSAAESPRPSAAAEAPLANRSALVTTHIAPAVTAAAQDLESNLQPQLEPAPSAIHPRTAALAVQPPATLSGQQLQPLEAPLTASAGLEMPLTAAANSDGTTGSLPQSATLNAATSALSPSAPATASLNNSVNAAAPGLHSALGSAVWGEEFSQHLLTMVHRGERQVDLHLHPRELGSLSVSLNLDDQGLRAQFLSANAAVRSAVEQALPQLRETLAQQGIALGETSVGQQQQQAAQQQHAAPQQSGNSTTAARPESDLESVDAPQSTAGAALPTRTNGLNGIDLYA